MMKYLSILALLTCCALSTAEESSSIDWQQARKVMNKDRQGQTLTAEEKQLLNQARTERKRLKERGEWPPAGAGRGNSPTNGEQTGTGQQPERTRRKVPNNADIIRGPQSGLTPLNQLGTETYKGKTGGLYANGLNEPTDAMRQQENQYLTNIVPRDKDGKPTKNGRIGLISIGMSNTNQIWQHFIQQSDQHPNKRKELVVVNGALGSHDIAQWGSQNDVDPWKNIDKQLATSDISRQQVQAVWLMHALRLAPNYGEFPNHTVAMQAELQLLVTKLKTFFPNLQIIHLSSRSYGGYDAGRGGITRTVCLRNRFCRARSHSGASQWRMVARSRHHSPVTLGCLFLGRWHHSA